jgi:hypothetical protein
MKEEKTKNKKCFTKDERNVEEKNRILTYAEENSGLGTYFNPFGELALKKKLEDFKGGKKIGW